MAQVVAGLRVDFKAGTGCRLTADQEAMLADKLTKECASGTLPSHACVSYASGRSTHCFRQGLSSVAALCTRAHARAGIFLLGLVPGHCRSGEAGMSLMSFSPVTSYSTCCRTPADTARAVLTCSPSARLPALSRRTKSPPPCRPAPLAHSCCASASLSWAASACPGKAPARAASPTRWVDPHRE